MLHCWPHTNLLHKTHRRLLPKQQNMNSRDDIILAGKEALEFCLILCGGQQTSTKEQQTMFSELSFKLKPSLWFSKCWYSVEYYFKYILTFSCSSLCCGEEHLWLRHSNPWYWTFPTAQILSLTAANVPLSTSSHCHVCNLCSKDMRKNSISFPGVLFLSRL